MDEVQSFLIPNTFIDKLINPGLSSEGHQMFMFFALKTWGKNIQWSSFNMQMIMEKTGLIEREVQRGIRDLISMDMLRHRIMLKHEDPVKHIIKIKLEIENA
jgi:hypothetical protein